MVELRVLELLPRDASALLPAELHLTMRVSGELGVSPGSGIYEM